MTMSLRKGDYSVLNPFQKVSKHVCTVYTYSNCMMNQSIIILLTNDLANICSEISKVWLILWMIYAWNVKGLGGEAEKLGRNECN